MFSRGLGGHDQHIPHKNNRVMFVDLPLRTINKWDDSEILSGVNSLGCLMFGLGW